MYGLPALRRWRQEDCGPRPAELHGSPYQINKSNLVKTELIRTGSVSEIACLIGRDQNTDTQREEHVSTWQESGHS